MHFFFWGVANIRYKPRNGWLGVHLGTARSLYQRCTVHERAFCISSQRFTFNFSRRVVLSQPPLSHLPHHHPFIPSDHTHSSLQGWFIFCIFAKLIGVFCKENTVMSASSHSVAESELFGSQRGGVQRMAEEVGVLFGYMEAAWLAEREGGVSGAPPLQPQALQMDGKGIGYELLLAEVRAAVSARLRQTEHTDPTPQSLRPPWRKDSRESEPSPTLHNNPHREHPENNRTWGARKDSREAREEPSPMQHSLQKEYSEYPQSRGVHSHSEAGQPSTWSARKGSRESEPSPTLHDHNPHHSRYGEHSENNPQHRGVHAHSETAQPSTWGARKGSTEPEPPAPLRHPTLRGHSQSSSLPEHPAADPHSPNMYDVYNAYEDGQKECEEEEGLQEEEEEEEEVRGETIETVYSGAADVRRSKQRSLLFCSGGHALQQFRVGKGAGCSGFASHRCNRCLAAGLTQWIFRCVVCDYDCCEGCASGTSLAQHPAYADL